MTHVEALKRANNEAEYREWLRSMPGLHKTSGRNNSLLSIVRAGIRTGRSDERLMAEIISAGGAPRLSDAEVRRAIAAAHRPMDGSGHARRVTLPSDGGAFFRAMVKAGAGFTEDTLWGTPPCRREQCRLHVNAIFDACDEAGTPGYLWWTGRHAWSPRDRRSLATITKIWNRTPLHQFVIPSPMSGMSADMPNGDGKGTHPCFACKATVETSPIIVCEYDRVAPEQQFAFWAGVLCEQTLDVRSIVWSGSKSYHALVKVPEGRDRSEYVAYLRSIMPDIDPAPMHPAGLTRLAGAVRPETGQLQRLVYCAR